MLSMGKKLKGMKFGKFYKEKCGTCKFQGIIKICELHLVKAPDKQGACNDYKIR